LGRMTFGVGAAVIGEAPVDPQFGLSVSHEPRTSCWRTPAWRPFKASCYGCVHGRCQLGWTTHDIFATIISVRRSLGPGKFKGAAFHGNALREGSSEYPTPNG
jgi:hypothetical protein